MKADRDRERFREHLRESDRYFKTGDANAANAETDALDTVLAPWKAGGREVEPLSALVEPSEPRNVRFAAASALFYNGHEDLGVPVREEIGNGPGMEAVGALAVLGERQSGHGQ